MKQIIISIATVIVISCSYAQQKFFGAFSNYSYSLFSKRYDSYPVDCKVFDTLVKVNYFSLSISKQNELSEIEYELMPFYYFKSCFSVHDAPTNTFTNNDFAHNYAGHINNGREKAKANYRLNRRDTIFSTLVFDIC